MPLRHNEDLVDLRTSEPLVGGRAGHHHGENQKVLMCPYLQQIQLAIESLMHIPGLTSLLSFGYCSAQTVLAVAVSENKCDTRANIARLECPVS